MHPQNVFAGEALPGTTPGKLTALLQLPGWISGGFFAAREGEERRGCFQRIGE